MSLTGLMRASALGFLFAVTAVRVPAEEPEHKPLVINSRLELFVDDYLVESMRGLDLVLQQPRPAGKVMVFDRPWEGVTTSEITMFKDGDRYRMYYGGDNASESVTRSLLKPEEKLTPQHRPVICYAESADGIHWTRPSLGLYEFAGSKDNNITWMDTRQRQQTKDMFVFRDDNPAVPATERYKALAGDDPPLMLLVSQDGLRWREPNPGKSLISEGLHRNAFDALSSCFWDAGRNEYVLIIRDMDVEPGQGWPPPSGHSTYNYHTRSFKYSTSRDFVNWSFPRWVDFGDVPDEHLYTNSVTPYFRAPHIYLGFPKRFVPWKTYHRDAVAAGASEAVFMTSRDGLHWSRRFMEAFVRPGRDERNWIDRNNSPVTGIAQTSSDEISFYIVRNYRFPTIHLERMTLRLDGFVALHAPYQGGELITKPIIFEGDRLVLNYSTAAAGSIRLEIQDDRGRPVSGFTLEDSPLIFGDAIERTVEWERSHPGAGREGSLRNLAGKPVRLRFVMKDADLYSIQFK